MGIQRVPHGYAIVLVAMTTHRAAMDTSVVRGAHLAVRANGTTAAVAKHATLITTHLHHLPVAVAMNIHATSQAVAALQTPRERVHLKTIVITQMISTGKVI